MLPHGPPAKALTSNFVLLSQEESRTKHFCLVTGKSCTDRLEQEHVCKHNSPFLGVMRVFSWAIADICQVAVCQQDIECLINHSMCASGSHLSEFDRRGKADRFSAFCIANCPLSLRIVLMLGPRDKGCRLAAVMNEDEGRALLCAHLSRYGLQPSMSVGIMLEATNMMCSCCVATGLLAKVQAVVLSWTACCHTAV